MALNPSTNPTMSGRVTAANPTTYPYASSKDESSPGANDGTPYFSARSNDIFGLQQALLTAASIVPNGNADDVTTSQYMQSLVELICGRAILYDDSGLADAYQLDAQSNQHAPQSLFDGLIFSFFPANSNTGASTLNFVGLGVKALLNSSGEPLVLGDILSGERISVTYSASGDEFLLLPQLNTATESRLLSGRKNQIINGDFDIWQLGTSFIASGLTADRWRSDSAGSSQVVTQQPFSLGQTDVPGEPKYFYRTVVTSVAGSSNLAIMTQAIEGVRTLAGQAFTLSFWAKADAAKNISIDMLQNFGTGGSPSSEVASNTNKITLTTGKQRYVITGTLPSIAGKTLGTAGNDKLMAYFWFDAGSDYNARTDSLGQQSGTFDIWGVQVEEGSVASDFEQLLPGEKLSLCQRYLCMSYPEGYYPGDAIISSQPEMSVQADSTARLSGYVTFPVAMRAQPTLTIYRPSNGVETGIEKWNETNIKAVNSAEVSRYGINSLGLNSSGTAGEPYQFHYVADAEL